MSTLRGFVRCLALAMLFALPASADVKKGDAEIGLDVGFTDFDGAALTTSGGRAVFRLGYLPTNVFEIEAQLGYSERSPSALTTGFINGVFNFHSGRQAVPYFLVGVGAANLDIDGIGDDTSIAGQLAGGVRAFGQHGKAGVRLEAGAIVEETFNETKTHFNLTVGIVFQLGSGHKHQPAKPSW